MDAGARVGRYAVAERLGAGAMGVVHAAHDPELDRRVAVKLMHDAAWSPRLVREAQALARLAHPNVVTVYDIGEHAGRVFIAMELVPGATLASWLAARPRSWREIVAAFLQAGRGLAAAHAAGYVHRDFKPDNVLVGEDGRARVSDFGLACLETTPPVAVPPDTPSDAITRTGVLAGTPAYMAPEQLDGAASDARADQFAFCVALFEALHGVRPFAGSTVAELRSAIERRAVQRGKRVPARVQRVLLRGLAADPAARFADMPALLAALERTRSRRGLYVLAAVALVAAVAVVAWRAAQPAAAATCTGAAAELAPSWNAARKTALRGAFAATKQPYAGDAAAAVEKTLDAYAREWVAMHDDACRATSDALDLRMQCLAERRAELAATVQLFAGADAGIVERAPRIANAMTPIATCADVAALRTGMPVPPPLRAPLAEQARTLAAIRVLDNAKRFTEARPQIETAVTRALALHFAPAEAEARFLAGSIARRDGDLPAADAHLRAAVRAAEAGRADALRADILVELVTLQTTWQHLDNARELAADATATVARLGRGPDAKLEQALGDLAHAAGKADDALAHYRAALAANRRSGDEFRTASSLGALGSLDIDMGHNADAEASFREAYEIQARLLGRAHPDVAHALGEVAESLRRQHKHDDALRALKEGLGYAERAHAQDETLALLLNAIADVTLDADRPRDALPFLDRAYELMIHGNRKRTALLNTVRLQGECALTLQRYDAALAKFIEAKQLIIEKKGEENVDIAFAEEAIASVYEHQARYKLAVTALEHSLALQQRETPDHLYLATTRFALARVLWPTGDRKRARELAEQARATWAENGDTGQASDAAAWLKSH